MIEPTVGQKILLTRGINIILRFNRNNNEGKFLDILDLKKSCFVGVPDAGKGLFKFLTSNKRLVEETILNDEHLRRNIELLTKKEIIDLEQNIEETKDCEVLKQENEKLKRYNAILEQCLDTKDELCKVLREDNERLRSQLRDTML